ncbi:rnp-7 [Pristionchus pacificus]|uniref:U1 small nuclear ribonucleoprotein 70 kDa n=1 Tax=Pristionchus pacificus TaxID=54126 RepID=A0A2A6BJ78_PRIPA|nr:rnp-7 [Pristionchus pacificus]|eukprot:PDM65949.1 rnp-7 [Pristionchus pacificus]
MRLCVQSIISSLLRSPFIVRITGVRMTQFLPDNLLQLFAPRPPIPYLPPAEVLLCDKKRAKMQGMAECVGDFETDPAPPKPVVETRDEKRARRRKEKEELLAYKIEQGIAMWNPAENPRATKDPYKTLFVARINYETSESKLKREFEPFGKIEKLTMVADKNGKPRGYAFIEYSHKSEMSAAYKKADGTKIDGRRVVVDYERGRTQKTWLPRRLGGGKGDTRRARESKAVLEARGEYVAPENNNRDRDDKGGDRGFGGPPRDGGFRGRDDRNGGGFGGGYGGGGRGGGGYGGGGGFGGRDGGGFRNGGDRGSFGGGPPRDRGSFGGPPGGGYGGRPRSRSRERRDDRRDSFGGDRRR